MPNAWKYKIWCGLLNLLCNWCAVVFYAIILGMTTTIDSMETFSNLTIYT